LSATSFRPHLKHGLSVLDDQKQMDEEENKVVWAMWEKLNRYIREELDED
jgi:hypothetical protein